MKKKLLFAILGLTVATSMLTTMVGCDDADDGGSHIHTYTIEWTTDDTHHWKGATCEHTTEVEEKTEHTWGEDGKCTVCQMEKPIAATVTQEQWISSIEEIHTTTNASVSMSVLSPELLGASLKHLVEKDGDKMRFVSEMGGTEIWNFIFVKTAEYAWDSVFNSYTASNHNMYIPSVLTWNCSADVAQVAKDKYSDATFDDTTKAYSLIVENTTYVEVEFMENSVVVPGIIELADMSFVFSFENGNIKSANVVCRVVSESCNGTLLPFNSETIFTFTFGGVEIPLPQSD